VLAKEFGKQFKRDSDTFLIARRKGNVLEHGMSHHLQGIHMSVMKRKKKNTDLERQKKLQREKDAKKKQMRNQLPAKQGKR